MKTACNYTQSLKHFQFIFQLLFLKLTVKLPLNLPLRRTTVCWRKTGGTRNSKWKSEAWSSSDKMKAKSTHQNYRLCRGKCVCLYTMFPNTRDPSKTLFYCKTFISFNLTTSEWYIPALLGHKSAHNRQRTEESVGYSNYRLKKTLKFKKKVYYKIVSLEFTTYTNSPTFQNFFKSHIRGSWIFFFFSFKIYVYSYQKFFVSSIFLLYSQCSDFLFKNIDHQCLQTTLPNMYVILLTV